MQYKNHKVSLGEECAMPKSVEDESITNVDMSEDEICSYDEEQATPTSSESPPRPAKASSVPKWRAIEEYWEQKRLRALISDALHDER